MAIVNISLNFILNIDTGVLSTSVSPHSLYRGDTARFTVQGIQAANGAGFTSFYAGSWESTIWADPSDVYITGAVDGAVFDKVVRADSVYASDVLGVDTIINGVVRYSNVGSITVSAPVDNTPDQFDLGPNLSGVQPADIFVSSLVTVSGINTGVNASISTTGGSAYFTVNNGTAKTSATVTNGQRIQVFGTADGAYSSSITVTLTIGGVSDSFVVTTTSTPPASALIQFVSNPITLNNIKAFFGGTLLPPNNPSNNLRAYYRGGAYVPDISQNGGVPSSGIISLQNFNISFTTLFFSKLPTSILTSTSTLGGSTSLSQTWSVGSSGNDKFDVGFGPGMKGAAQFSYSIVEDTGGNKSTGVTLSVQTGQPGTPRQGNTYVIVQSPQVSGNSEARYSGTLTITATYGGVSRSATCKYYFNFYGP